MQNDRFDFLIIGAGIVGLTLAFQLQSRSPGSRILILEKEDDVGRHASGRNSGVLHAGFYYTADSLKARLTVAGNEKLRRYCAEKGLPVNECGKLVVAQNEEELERLYELEKRGRVNGSSVELIDEDRARELEPNVRTFRKALYSPRTATINPEQLCLSLRDDLRAMGVEFAFGAKYLGHRGQTVLSSSGDFTAARIVNCAGLYADKIARDFGFGRSFAIVPFKGLYLKYAGNHDTIRMHIYPVPNLKNPFLGVHFTKTVDGGIKIGPTAIPAFWRENYSGFKGFSLAEMLEVGFYEALLFATNSFNFRDLAFEEIRKYSRKYFIGLAAKMVQHIDERAFGNFTRPGIRAQLLHRRTLALVQDFVVEGDHQSTHVLNAVSPALTCSFPFADYVIDNFIKGAV